MKRKSDICPPILYRVLEAVVGQHVQLVEEGLSFEECLTIPVTGLSGCSLQSWLTSLPVRHGGMGLNSQASLIPAAFIGTLEQALPFFGGERGVCPPLVASDSRTGRELVTAWRE